MHAEGNMGAHGQLLTLYSMSQATTERFGGRTTLRFPFGGWAPSGPGHWLYSERPQVSLVNGCNVENCLYKSGKQLILGRLLYVGQ